MEQLLYNWINYKKNIAKVENRPTGFDEGYKLKPTKSGYIMYGEKEPDRFDFVKFST